MDRFERLEEELSTLLPTVFVSQENYIHSIASRIDYLEPRIEAERVLDPSIALELDLQRLSLEVELYLHAIELLEEHLDAIDMLDGASSSHAIEEIKRDIDRANSKIDRLQGAIPRLERALDSSIPF